MNEHETPEPLRIEPSDFTEKGTEEQIAALYSAIAEARGEFRPIPKDKEGQIGHQRFKYAPLATIEACTTPALTKFGLGILQPFSITDGLACIRTVLCHKGGGRLIARFCFQPHSDLKELGKQSTYYARYAYQRILCIDSGEDADNDGAPSPSGAAPTKNGERFRGSSAPRGQALVRPADRDGTEDYADAATVEAPEHQAPRGEPRQTRPKPKPVTKADVPSEAFLEGPEDQHESEEQEPAEATDGPPISAATSNALNALFVKNRVKAQFVVDLCQKVTGKHPDELGDAGGEALGLKLLAAANKEFS